MYFYQKITYNCHNNGITNHAKDLHKILKLKVGNANFFNA